MQFTGNDDMNKLHTSYTPDKQRKSSHDADNEEIALD